MSHHQCFTDQGENNKSTEAGKYFNPFVVFTPQVCHINQSGKMKRKKISTKNWKPVSTLLEIWAVGPKNPRDDSVFSDFDLKSRLLQLVTKIALKPEKSRWSKSGILTVSFPTIHQISSPSFLIHFYFSWSFFNCQMMIEEDVKKGWKKMMLIDNWHRHFFQQRVALIMEGRSELMMRGRQKTARKYRR